MLVTPAFRLTALAALLFAPALLCRPGTVAAQTRIESYHGAWTIRCNIGSNDPALCAAATRKFKSMRSWFGYGSRRIEIKVVRARGVLYFQVAGPERRDNPGPVLLKLGGELVKTIPFNCRVWRAFTCIAQTPFSTSLRSRFRQAKTVTIEFVQKNGKLFTMTVPLNGLEDALAALAKR